MDSKPVPWFAPKVSPALNTIVRNLGHRVDKSKGDVLYETGSMFERLFSPGLPLGQFLCRGLKTPHSSFCSHFRAV